MITRAHAMRHHLHRLSADVDLERDRLHVQAIGGQALLRREQHLRATREQGVGERLAERRRGVAQNGLRVVAQVRDGARVAEGHQHTVRLDAPRNVDGLAITVVQADLERFGGRGTHSYAAVEKRDHGRGLNSRTPCQLTQPSLQDSPANPRVCPYA